MEYRSIRIASRQAIAGEPEFYKTLPTNFTAFLAAADESDLAHLGLHAIGRFISPQGSFTFEQDPVTSWMSKSEPHLREFQDETGPIRWAAKRLGSITLRSYAIFYTDGSFTGFWIDAFEENKIRVFTSEKDSDGLFEGMPEGFQFTPTWIANVISARF